jgi:hypothetical protein
MHGLAAGQTDRIPEFNTSLIGRGKKGKTLIFFLFKSKNPKSSLPISIIN